MTPVLDGERSDILSSMSVLMRRRADTHDEEERRIITGSLATLNAELDTLEQSDLLGAAVSVARASDALERAIAAARVQPFGDYLTLIGNALRHLGQIAGEMHAVERLSSAEASPQEPSEALDVAEVSIPVISKASAPASPAAIRADTRYSVISDEFESMYKLCILDSTRQANVDYYIERMLKFKGVYQGVSAKIGALPWQFVGITHALEAGFDFSRHLHNGDLLEARTVHAPSGRPTAGSPPFTWRESAIDALMLKGLHQIGAWPLSRVLYELERYNGFGYRLRGLPTPYLWSFTNQYVTGKFVRDREFDPQAVSKQCGGAAMLLGLTAKGEGL